MVQLKSAAKLPCTSIELKVPSEYLISSLYTVIFPVPIMNTIAIYLHSLLHSFSASRAFPDSIQLINNCIFLFFTYISKIGTIFTNGPYFS